MKGSVLLLCLVFGPMAAALLSYLIGKKNKTARNFFADGVTALELAAMLVLFLQKASGGADLYFNWSGFCGMGLTLMLDGFRGVYGLVAAFMWFMTTLFSRQYFGHYRNRNRYYFFLLLTLGATMGVFLSADLYTTFIFFEIMSFTSYVWVVHEENPGAMRAGETYLAVAVIGGMVMLMGIFLLWSLTGTLQLSELLDASRRAAETNPALLYTAGGLMVFGFGAKAGMFPLHIWLPKAHPVAPAPASALLSGILTKAGVFGILAVTCNIFLHNVPWGQVILLLGTVTMFGGAMLAVFSVDLKRTLACSSMSQIGFILVGVGMQCLLGEENALAVRGTLLHMVNHSLIKLDLFMVAGVVYMNLHKLNLNDIRGFGRKKPLLACCFLMGALGIGGIPGWNGYISKTLLHESIVEYLELAEELGLERVFLTVKSIEWIFLISGGMTVAYMLKLFISLFVEENTDKARQADFDAKTDYWNWESKLAIAGSALVLPVLGMLPGLTMNRLADLGTAFMHGELPAHGVHYFAWANLKGGLISIAIGVVLYFGVIRTLLMDREGHYLNRWPAWLDLEDRIYRPLLTKLLPKAAGFCGTLLDRVMDCVPALVAVGAAAGTVLDRVLDCLPAVLAVGAAAGRALDKLPDSLIVLARKTTHRAVETRHNDLHEHVLGTTLGGLLQSFDSLRNHTTRRKNPIRRDRVLQMVEWQERTARTAVVIRGSLAFALIMACTGLIALLLYIALV